MNRFLLLASLLFLSAPIAIAQTTSLDPAVQTALTEGSKFEQRHQLTSALDSDRKALKLAKGNCAPCYEAIVNLQLAMNLPKDAVATAGIWIAHTATPIEKSRAQYLQAVALMRENTVKADPSLLTQAEQTLKLAIDNNRADPDSHMLRGRVLAALKQDSDARSEFVACAATPGASAAECARANTFATNVDLARGEPAPAFTIPGPDGTPITLDSLAGKVVLIDFWATWCPPCNKDLSYIQGIADEFRKDKFVLLGVSSDSNENSWKRYKQVNDMLGIQVRDSFEGLGTLFHVSGIPTYIVIDANGMIRLRVTGPEGDIRGKVRTLLAQIPKQPPVQNAATSPASIQP